MNPQTQSKLLIIGLMLATFGIMWFLTWAFSTSFDQDEIKQIFWFFLSLLGIGSTALFADNKVTKNIKEEAKKEDKNNE